MSYKPKIPHHPEPHTHIWTILEGRAISDAMQDAHAAGRASRDAEVEALQARVLELEKANSDLAAAAIVPDGYQLTPVPAAPTVLLEQAFLAGFNSSGEGFNGEYPFADNDRDPAADSDWLEKRSKALAALQATPPAKALTDAELEALANAHCPSMTHYQTFARAIERALKGGA